MHFPILIEIFRPKRWKFDKCQVFIIWKFAVTCFWGYKNVAICSPTYLILISIIHSWNIKIRVLLINKSAAFLRAEFHFFPSERSQAQNSEGNRIIKNIRGRVSEKEKSVNMKTEMRMTVWEIKCNSHSFPDLCNWNYIDKVNAQRILWPDGTFAHISLSRVHFTVSHPIHIHVGKVSRIFLRSVKRFKAKLQQQCSG